MRGSSDLHIDFDGQLRGRLAECLLRHAARREVRPVDLLATIVEVVMQDDLVDAILDDAPVEKPRAA